MYWTNSLISLIRFVDLENSKRRGKTLWVPLVRGWNFQLEGCWILFSAGNFPGNPNSRYGYPKATVHIEYFLEILADGLQLIPTHAFLWPLHQHQPNLLSGLQKAEVVLTVPMRLGKTEAVSCQQLFSSSFTTITIIN